MHSAPLPHDLNLPDLTFRHGRGEVDYPALFGVHQDSWGTDSTDHESTFEPYHGLISTIDDIAAAFRWSDPDHDVLIAEVGDKVVGYARAGNPYIERDGTRNYWVDTLVAPPYRGHHIEDALLSWLENRFREREEEHGLGGSVVYTAAASNLAHGPRTLLERFGYPLFIDHDDFALTDFDLIPKAANIDGIELLPVTQADFRAAWDVTVAVLIAIHPTYGFGSEEEYQERLKSPGLGLGITWAARHVESGEMVGAVLCEISRGRGAVEQFAIREDWRRRGIGKALLIRATHAMQRQGVSSIRVHTESDNAFGSRPLYESVGFRLVKHQGFYRKIVA